jgi:hypothetical protein
MIMKKWCPRCNQGWVIATRIHINGKIVQVCEECEALWPNKNAIESHNFLDMAAYLKSIGLNGIGDELESLK